MLFGGKPTYLGVEVPLDFNTILAVVRTVSRAPSLQLPQEQLLQPAGDTAGGCGHRLL